MRSPILPSARKVLAAEGNEIDICAIENQFHTHQNAQYVSLGGHADGTRHKHHRSDEQIMRNVNRLEEFHYDPSSVSLARRLVRAI